MSSSVTSASLRSSIPSPILSKCSSHLVKQVVITKQSPIQPSPKSGIPGMNNIAVGPAGRRLSKMGTSKLHKFKPAVALDQALQWLAEYGEADSSIMFENENCILFEAGKFFEFEGKHFTKITNNNYSCEIYIFFSFQSIEKFFRFFDYFII